MTCLNLFLVIPDMFRDSVNRVRRNEISGCIVDTVQGGRGGGVCVCEISQRECRQVYLDGMWQRLCLPLMFSSLKYIWYIAI